MWDSLVCDWWYCLIFHQFLWYTDLFANIFNASLLSSSGYPSESSRCNCSNLTAHKYTNFSEQLEDLKLYILLTNGGPMPHSQGLSNNPYPRPNQPNSSYWYLFLLRSILILSSHLGLGLSKSLFSIDLPVKKLKVFLPSCILATYPANLSILDLITMSTSDEWYKLRIFSWWIIN